MGKGRPRAVEKGVLGQGLSVLSSASLNVPPGPVYYPTEDEFKNPLAFICKIRAEAEPYGICKIVPPKSWKPPFALDMNCFTFPTKTQAIHQLQARPAACDPGTFELEYNRFLEEHHGRKAKKRVVFEGEDMDLCRFFNAVKRYGGYDKVVDEKKWGDVFRFVRRGKKISECSKHVLSQLYWEYLYDYEKYYNQLNNEMYMGCKRGVNGDKDSGQESKFFGSKRRRRNYGLERVEVCKMEDIEPNQICEQCKSGSHGEVMLLCDKCNKGWHIYCLSPPLKQVPLGNWYCLECFNSDKDTFGFVPGKRFSLEAFRRMAERVKKKWFGSVPVSRTQLERKFWEIVEGLAGEVEVVYGSDLDTSVYGSGFPRANDKKPESVEDELWDAYCSSPWNLNNLPKLRGSMLRAVHHNIAGVMVPWLYIGMLFSSFCWHFEDHCFYSMNYLHWGEPKCWYSVPGSEVCAFEEVMRKSLPDLFDAQPDLLFQLVTMLNPSVLRENGVPVFSILQEPGNFVITFPRSYHAGFNFGLNCAEAVNFAPADWLPHGGFAANLYQQYHRAAVLSHEELLCVVAKNDHDAKTSSYLKKELFRMYSKEKTWRERLWRSGVVYSSRMAPRKFPMYVGTEEDPTCIICQQSLYLSAIICCCRPSTFVCLEHWKHLCECKPRKHRLLYRNSLAELEELVLATDDLSSDRTPQRGILQGHLSCLDRTSDLTKKVKGANVSFFQLAENWLLRARKALGCPYSSAIYAKALKEAEQFLWAGSEMDSVRDMTRKLVESQNWAEDIICCLSKIEKRPCHRSHKSSKVHLEHINNLLSTTPFSCYDSGHLRLKEFAEQARILIREMNTTLTSCSEVTIAELGKLYKKACDFPVYAEEIENLADMISAMKVWMSSVSKCFIERTPAAIKVDMLHKLKSEMLELQVQVPERELLLDLLRRAEFCRMHCSDILKGPMTLKGVEMVLQEFESFSVDIPELRLLRQHYADAISWISRFNDVSLDIHEREDQENVVDELNCILKDGASLKIKVDELPRLEIELKKACLRHRAMKAMASKMSTDLMNQIMAEALVLQVENEKCFIGISRVREAAMHWEERARDLFACRADISDFEHALRTADDISAILPSLDDVRDAISMANSWLKNSRPFLRSVFSVPIPSSSLLKVEDLKELVSQSKLLNISLQEQTALERVLTNCEEWEEDACCLIQKAECLLNTDGVGDGLLNNVTSKIGSMVQKMESVIDAGLVLGFQFNGTPKLQEARSSLKWCSRALSFCSVPSTLEEVHNLLDVARNIPVRWASTSLFRSLVEGIEWLREALEAVLLVSHNHKRCKLSDAEDILAESRAFNVFFPWMVDQLLDAIRKHRSWQDEVSLFFNLKFTERSWSRLLHLKELGDRAFNCTELDFLLSEVEKIDKWRQNCLNSIGPSVGGVNNLLGVLLEIKDTLKKSLYIYDQARSWNMIDSCMWCFTSFKGKELSSCSICKDCFHLQCIGLKLADAIGEQVYKCPYCLFVETGSVPWDGGISFRTEAKGPELKMLLDLLSDSQDFCVWIDEKHALEKVLEEALACKAHLAAITDYALAYLGEDVSVVAKKLTIALKAVKMAGVNYCQGNSNLDLALARNSWRIRSCKLLEGPRKPSLQQIQRSVKEALALGIQPGDCFWQKLTGLEQIGLQWADSAKKVVRDSGALGLDKVFDLIIEGEKLPVHFEKELRSLRERSKLYCICRKPDDRRAMIACDLCDEWYHFDCMRLSSVPKFYICPACKPQMEELSSSQSTDLERSDGAKFGVPRTPSPPCSELRAAKAREPKRKVVAAKEGGGNLPPIASSGIGLVSWQNCRPFRRRAKKRAEFQSISPFYHTK